MPTTFFDLPHELPDLVYDHLWRYETPSICIRQRNASGYAVYASPPSVIYPIGTKRGLPIWLLTSNAMLHEGTEQFQRAGLFSVDVINPSALPSYIQKSACKISAPLNPRLCGVQSARCKTSSMSRAYNRTEWFL
jgi:hypothetical protein